MSSLLNSKEHARCLLADLRGKIEGGVLLPGSQLPSESQLCTDFMLSRPTVRRILEKLSQAQLIEKKPGIGTFVKDSTEKKPLSLFRIGVDCFFYSGQYYKSIWSGLSSSPFGKNCYFHLLDKEKLQLGILDNDVDGILLCGFDGEASVLEKLKNTGKPLIVINRCIHSPDNVAYVTVDHRQETASAVTHLFRYGHQKIAFIGNCPSSGALHLRFQGWMDAYHNEGLAPPENLQLSMSECVHPEFGRKLQQFLSGEKFTALVFGNEAVFQRFCFEYHRVACHWQHQPEIIVFDDVSTLMETQTLFCSYIQMPLQRFGAVAAEFLRQKKANPQLQPIQQILPCNLVVRHMPLGNDEEKKQSRK
ncbi:MAG: GntR family transcriptional regulator [Lentisphaeria bacterium]